MVLRVFVPHKTVKCTAVYVHDMVRPTLDDELVEDMKKIVDQASDIDPDRVGTEHNLEILLSKIGDIEVSDTHGGKTTAGKIREKYR